MLPTTMPFFKSTAQRGFVLVTAVMFLAVLSLIAAMSMRSAVFEERVANNEQDYIQASQAAELALRDAENDIRGIRFDSTATAIVYCATNQATCGGNLRPAGLRPSATNVIFWLRDLYTFTASSTISTDTIRPTAISGTNIGFYSKAAMDLCGRPLWQAADWIQDNPATQCTGGGIVRTVSYGEFTGAPSNIFGTGVRAPRYLVELMDGTDMGITLRTPTKKLYFRITAVGFGRLNTAGGNTTSVTLQEMYSPL